MYFHQQGFRKKTYHFSIISFFFSFHSLFFSQSVLITEKNTVSKWIYCSLVSRRRRTAERTEAAAVVEYTQAPPATTRLHLLHDQMPTQARFMESYKEIASEFWVKSF